MRCKYQNKCHYFKKSSSNIQAECQYLGLNCAILKVNEKIGFEKVPKSLTPFQNKKARSIIDSISEYFRTVKKSK